MSLTEIIITALALGIIVGGIYVLKKSARKFNLTPEQLKKIKQRNEMLDKEEQEEKTK
ncbi:MAG: DUF2897 family protein [Colwellia sp.]|uniref:DUF2897 family protein n=1 Tax=Colwellia sp. TaxID=56799 RepID=UPI0025BBC969|nr:DUF2897 family protein [Colwellia sp.]NQZ25015.1 DUF2897 family protein [Colwellia sp.]